MVFAFRFSIFVYSVSLISTFSISAGFSVPKNGRVWDVGSAVCCIKYEHV